MIETTMRIPTPILWKEVHLTLETTFPRGQKRSIEIVAIQMVIIHTLIVIDRGKLLAMWSVEEILGFLSQIDLLQKKMCLIARFGLGKTGMRNCIKPLEEMMR